MRAGQSPRTDAQTSRARTSATSKLADGRPDWHTLYPRERWMWFERLWTNVCMLRDRYRLPVRSGWWEHQLQVEALAALAAWVDRYDSGDWTDPPGKLALLYDLERVAELVRDGEQPFDSDRDRLAFPRCQRGKTSAG